MKVTAEFTAFSVDPRADIIKGKTYQTWIILKSFDIKMVICSANIYSGITQFKIDCVWKVFLTLVIYIIIFIWIIL